MSAMLNTGLIGKFNTKKLYKKIIDLFDDYNINKLAMRGMSEKFLFKNLEDTKKKFIEHKSDPMLEVSLAQEKRINKILDFEEKIKFLKTQFTDDEAIIFHHSLEERELDKEIMNIVCKSDHKYYQIKKSCYTKIALCFGILEHKIYMVK